MKAISLVAQGNRTELELSDIFTRINPTGCLFIPGLNWCWLSASRLSGVLDLPPLKAEKGHDNEMKGMVNVLFSLKSELGRQAMCDHKWIYILYDLPQNIVLQKKAACS